MEAKTKSVFYQKMAPLPPPNYLVVRTTQNYHFLDVASTHNEYSLHFNWSVSQSSKTSQGIKNHK